MVKKYTKCCWSFYIFNIKLLLVFLFLGVLFSVLCGKSDAGSHSKIPENYGGPEGQINKTF